MSKIYFRTTEEIFPILRKREMQINNDGSIYTDYYLIIDESKVKGQLKPRSIEVSASEWYSVTNRIHKIKIIKKFYKRRFLFWKYTDHDVEYILLR